MARPDLSILAWLPPLFALGAAALFGLNVHVQGRALRGADALTGAFLSVGAMAALFWLCAPFVIDWHWFLTSAAAVFALAGLGFPAMGQAFQVASVGRVGPSLTSAIGSFTPIFAITPAILFMGETLRPLGALGLGLMILGLILSALTRRGIPRGFPLWALLLPLAAAAGRGMAQPVLKIGLDDVASPFFAALVTATVSTAVLGLVVLRRRAVAAAALPHSRRALWLFALSGVINGMGILSLSGAVMRGDLTLVSPLIATSPLWSLFFGIVAFRGEKVTGRHLLVASLVVAGAVLLVTR